MAHQPTPNEIAMQLEGKTREAMIPVLKEFIKEIRSQSYREGYQQGCSDTAQEEDWR